MKHLTRGLIAVFVYAAIAGHAQESENARDGFRSENLLANLSKQLDLKAGQLDSLKPMVDAKSEEILGIIDDKVDQGFTGLQSLTREASAAVKGLEENLATVLSDPEVQKVKEFLENLDTNAVEAVVNELVGKAASQMEVTQEQLQQIRPTLEKEIRDVGTLLDQTLAKGTDAFNEFETGSRDIWQEARERLGDVLTPEQLAKADAWRNEIESKVEKLFRAVQKKPMPKEAMAGENAR